MTTSGASIGRGKPLHAPGAGRKMGLLYDVVAPGTLVDVPIYFTLFIL